MHKLLDLTAVAQLVGDPTRLKMLAALLTEDELAAGELAAVAGVSPQTASAHLRKLQQGGLIKHAFGSYGGRHRVFRLSDDDVARAVEALLALTTTPTTKLKVPDATVEQEAKLCYDHLGGALGNALLETLLKRSLLEPAAYSFVSLNHYRVTSEGTRVLHDFGIDLAKLNKQRRNFAKRCLNTDEANAHLSGSLAEALLRKLLERRWVELGSQQRRAVELTEAGREGLARHFSLHL